MAAPKKHPSFSSEVQTDGHYSNNWKIVCQKWITTVNEGYDERQGDTKFQVWFLHQKNKRSSDGVCCSKNL